ncbi:MAG: DUF29 domain-containing protein, partial [Planctomycetaceae bacterium]|nr:DUF29 domain-containing protein [Planctomycetaceae bacterium]
TAMANRDRDEVFSRLAILIEHMLKWEYQPSRRGNSWRRTIVVQRLRLRRRLASGSLRRHAETILQDAYRDGVAAAAAATGIARAAFPATCPWTLEQLLEDAER